MTQKVCTGAASLRKVSEIVAGLNPSVPWKIDIRRHQARRTTSQNRLLWAIYTELASETGHTTEEIHEFCKERFLPRRVMSLGSEEREIAGSTAQLDKPSFSDYVERVASWAAQEFGVSA